jgi:hypothetical protein
MTHAWGHAETRTGNRRCSVTTAPKWATPERKKRLVELWQRYGNRCLQGHPVCPDPTHYIHHTVKVEVVAVPGRPFRARDSDGGSSGPLVQPLVLKRVPVAGMELCRQYELAEEGAIRQWRSEDISERTAEWRAERRRLHQEPDSRFKQGGFDSLMRERYLVGRGAFHPVTLTIDPLTFRRVAVVRIPSTGVRLIVDVHEVTGSVSKGGRRKASRYGVPLPRDVAVQVDRAVNRAVADWWARRAG